MRERIEVAKRFQFISEKLQSHGPRTRGRIDVEDAPAQGGFAFLCHLRFWFVTLFFKPLDQIERLKPVAPIQIARALLQIIRRESSLLQRFDTSNDERRVLRVACSSPRQRDQSFQPFADDIGVRQLRLVRQGFPRGVEERLSVVR